MCIGDNLTSVLHYLLFDDAAVRIYDGNTPRDHLAGSAQRVCDRLLYASAAWDRHPYHCDAFDVVFFQDLRQFFRVIHVVKLGAADERNFSANKIVVEIPVGKRRAVCRNQQVGPIKVRRVYRNQFDLHRSLRKLGIHFGRSCGRCRGFRRCAALDDLGIGARTPAGQRRLL